MTDLYKVYTKVLKALKQMVKLHHPGHVVTLAMMIAGIVMSKRAQLWMILQGLQVIAQNQIGWIDRTDRQDKSLFRLGLDWIRHCLKRDWDFEPLCWFQPDVEVVNVR